LRAWDGVIGEHGAGAPMYIYFFCTMAANAARAKAPSSWEWALGKGFGGLIPFTLFADRRFEHVAEMLVRKPDGWFECGWDEAIDEALSSALRALEAKAGCRAEQAAWGKIRPVLLKHLIFGDVP